MLDLAAAAWACAAVLGVAALFWLLSFARNDVGIVDSLWPLMFLLMVGVYQDLAPVPGPRVWLVLVLVAVWALRLSLHLTVRNYGQPEDRRYRAMRHNNEPHFGLKSLYLVFGLQAALAGFIAMPLLVASSAPAPLSWLDVVGVALWLIGMFFEVVGDFQLARFRAEPSNAGRVLDTGLWRFTRHPNYFGEFLVWWGYFTVALAAGGWWTLLSPLVMSALLLRVSGVTLLERDIGERRPGYASYARRTNAFLPGPPRVLPE